MQLFYDKSCTFEMLKMNQTLKIKNMKKIYFIIAAAVSMFFAAEAYAQIGVGVGYNMLNNVQKALDEDASSSLNGFYLEATYDINFLDKSWGELGIQPGVRFTYAGTQESEELLGVVTKASERETYLDIPVLVKYSYDLNVLKLSAFAGPVVSCGVSSVAKVSAGDNVVKGNNYDENSAYGRFDIKFGLGLGATFMDKFNAKIGYNLGMLNRYTGNIDEVALRTGVMYIGVGINF